MSLHPLGTRQLRLTIDGEERTADVSKCTIKSAKSDTNFISFADAANGGKRQYSLIFTATQDPADPDSIWNLVWEHTGEDMAVVVMPYGGAAASATSPYFSGTVTVSEPDGDLLGGEADESTTAKMTFDLEWVFLDKPTKVTA